VGALDKLPSRPASYKGRAVEIVMLHGDRALVYYTASAATNEVLAVPLDQLTIDEKE
jgi:hypothetical protein